MKLTYKFVDLIPNNLEEGVLYVSVTHGTALHLCCCGCRREVVTPLTPTDWKLIFDGETVSLYPSIGNWNFSCRSHYWISNNRVEWAPDWSEGKIEKSLTDDLLHKKKYYKGEDIDNQQENYFWTKLWNRRL
jgi:hypothetical protein